MEPSLVSIKKPWFWSSIYTLDLNFIQFIHICMSFSQWQTKHGIASRHLFTLHCNIAWNWNKDVCMSPDPRTLIYFLITKCIYKTYKILLEGSVANTNNIRQNIGSRIYKWILIWKYGPRYVRRFISVYITWHKWSQYKVVHRLYYTPAAQNERWQIISVLAL